MRKNKLISALVASTMLVTLTSACAKNISSSTYSEASVGEASFTYQGVIIGKRLVTVKQSEKLANNGFGQVAGGVSGGVLGHQVGRGKGNAAATIGGAIVGAVVGSMVEDKLNTQEAIEYTVKLTNGQIMTVVQGKENELQNGQNVFVITSNDGRSRITPDNSGTYGVQKEIHRPKTSVVKVR